MKTSSRLSAGGVLAVAVVAFLGVGVWAGAATITPQNGHNVQAYVNPFAASAKTGGPYSSDGSTAVDLSATLARQQGAADSSSAYWQFVRTAGAGTYNSVLTYHYQYTGFDRATPYSIKLGGTTTLTGPGTVGLKDWNLAPLPAPVTTDTLRIEFANLAQYSGQWYGDFFNVMPFEQKYMQLSPTVSSNSPIYYTSEGSIPEMLRTEWADYDDGWFPAAQADPDTRYFVLDLNNTARQQLAFILLQVESRVTGIAAIDLQRWAGSSWLTFATVSGLTANEYVAMLLPDGIAGTQIRFDGGSGSNANALSRALFLAVEVPEPASVALLGFAALALFRRRQGR